ncbi:hypothetical protein MalM25_24550 [Planctomycetes bacterium MalM25]|nr:hypothetical protein MalM25_24550 [Planctomycetes bacterium MalM25]
MALALALAPLAAPAQTPAGEPVYWSSHRLAIPYNWAGKSSEATEVVLFYSADAGRTWRKAGSALPHVRSFQFQAPADGEYWFAIRTYDRSGRTSPAGPLGPEMRVVVDSERPRFEGLDAQIRNGRLVIDLTASDAGGIDASRTHAYIQVEGQPSWTPVPLTPGLPGGGVSTRLTGEVAAPAGATRVAVRASVTDRAGNREERSASAVAPAAPSAPSPSLFAGLPNWSPSRAPAPTAPLDPFAAAESAARSRTPAAPVGFGAPPPSFREPPRREPPASTPWPSQPARSRPLIASKPTPPPSAPSSSPFGVASFRPSGEGPLRDPIPLPSARDGTPSRLVNNTEFEFEYELEATGRWGVAKVELWGTDNDGRSWRRFAIDGDRQSPIHVSTPGEGEYGFRLVVESVGGLEAPTPRPGDRPEAIVGVDLQAPRVTLGGARQGDGYFGDQLVIDWRADDRHLAERPIDLFYSNRPSGPWLPIATGLANSGRHSWRLQRHLPRSMYLRIEARDEAGNVGSVTTPEAIQVETPSASGSLRGVRPAG